jgi:hypothetical protein
MTIVQWSLLLNAVVSVLVAGGGFWLKKIVDQQLKTKDALIVSLEAAIKSKDLQIARRNESALGIAAARKQVKAFADESEAAQLFRGRAEGFLDALTIIGSRLQEMPQLFPSAPYSTSSLLAVLQLVVADLTHSASKTTRRLNELDKSATSAQQGEGRIN